MWRVAMEKYAKRIAICFEHLKRSYKEGKCRVWGHEWEYEVDPQCHPKRECGRCGLVEYDGVKDRSGHPSIDPPEVDEDLVTSLREEMDELKENTKEIHDKMHTPPGRTIVKFEEYKD